jgi:hypothetical protein
VIEGRAGFAGASFRVLAPDAAWAQPAAVLRLARASWGKALRKGDQAPAEFARLALRGVAAAWRSGAFESRRTGLGAGRAERLRHGRGRLGRAAARGAGDTWGDEIYFGIPVTVIDRRR